MPLKYKIGLHLKKTSINVTSAGSTEISSWYNDPSVTYKASSVTFGSAMVIVMEFMLLSRHDPENMDAKYGDWHM